MLLSLDKIDKVSVNIPGNIFFIGEARNINYDNLRLEVRIPALINSPIFKIKISAMAYFPKRNSPAHPQIINIAIPIDCFGDSEIPDEIKSLTVEI